MKEIFPRTESELIEIVHQARIENFKIHAVSTGNNWGYGSRLPYDEGVCIVNLSQMNRILDFDDELGTLRIEPGVTQAQLAEFLDKNNYNYLVPTTGAGGHVSLLGNTLERGYGLTPWVDHFLSLTSLRAVLADGSIYESFYQQIGCDDIAAVYKWGLGPYLDGLFSQSSLGIVTSATLCLKRKTEKISFVLAGASSEEELHLMFPVVRDLMNDSGQMIAGVNFINSLRTASMMQSCPSPALVEKRSLCDDEVRNLENTHHISPWNMVLTIYGSNDLVRTLEKRIQQKLSFLQKKPMIFNEDQFKKIDSLFRFLPFLKSAHKYKQFQKLKKIAQIFYGRPDNSAHQLTNWRTGQNSPAETRLDQSEVGLMWYAPLIPFKTKNVTAAVQMITRVVRSYGFDPLITLTATSDRYFVATLSLCFSRETSEETERAKRCYEELVREGLHLGIYPYRNGTLSLGTRPERKMNLGFKLKQLLDPDRIFDPGRRL